MLQVQEDVRGYYSDRYASGSIGAVGHIAPASANRLKGFITRVIRDSESTSLFNDIVQSGISRMNQSQGDSVSKCPTRLSVRAIVEKEFGDNARDCISKAVNIEANIALNCGYDLIYAGSNSNGRSTRSYDEIANAYSQVIQDTWCNMKDAHAFKLFFDMETAQAKANGYVVNEISASNVLHEYQRIISLLAIFGYDSSESDSIIQNQDNLIVGAYKGDDLIGLGVAERRRITLDNGEDIYVAELTDAFVIPEHRGNNMYFLISTHEILNLIRDNNQIDLIYGESNLDEIAVLKSAARQGRRFAGILPEHAIIGNSAKSLAVTYLNKEDTLKISNHFGIQ